MMVYVLHEIVKITVAREGKSLAPVSTVEKKYESAAADMVINSTKQSPS
jgi:hypothetical protein